MFLDFLQQYPFILAFILGLIPALVWLWFWLKEDIHPEPAKMITLSFIGGMVAVLFVLPFHPGGNPASPPARSKATTPSGLQRTESSAISTDRSGG